MATKKKAPAKKTTARKEQPPIRIIVEVVIRNDVGSDNKNKALSLLTDGGGSSPNNNFSFSFEAKDITVLNITVGNHSQDRPPATGNFFTPVLDPNTPQKIRVIVLAREDFPGGNGTLSLKYNGKELSANPVSISFSGGMGGIDQLLTLPS